MLDTFEKRVFSKQIVYKRTIHLDIFFSSHYSFIQLNSYLLMIRQTYRRSNEVYCVRLSHHHYHHHHHRHRVIKILRCFVMYRCVQSNWSISTIHTFSFDVFTFVYLSAYECSLFDDERLGEREREKQDVLEIVHTHTYTRRCDNILPDNERNLCLSLCLKHVHAIQVCGIYTYTNMIKGYIAETCQHRCMNKSLRS